MININKAAKRELVKLKGVGAISAEKISEFRKKGGVINSISELKVICNIQERYVEALKSEIAFSDVNAELEKPHGPWQTINPGFDNSMTDVKFHLFNFKVKFQGQDDTNLPDITGYQLSVGYKTTRSRARSKISYTQKIINYNLDNSSHLDIAIPKTNLAENSFNLILKRPDGDQIYNSTLQIDENKEVIINLPVFDNAKLFVKILKQPGVNYEGYKLEYTLKINRGGSGIDTRKKNHEFASVNEIALEWDCFGSIENINIELLSPNGEQILELDKTLEEIETVNNKKIIEIKLPEPAIIDYTIQLAEDINLLTNPYLDHKIILTFDLINPQTLNFIKRISRSFDIDSKGRAKIVFNHYALVEMMSLEVKAPGGEIISKKEIAHDEIIPSGEVKINVPPRKISLAQNIEKMPERPKKTTCRVIDADGGKKFTDVQVIIYTATRQNPEEDDFKALIINRTETNGYFIIDTPQDYFTGAFARIGIPGKEYTHGKTIDVPVLLDEDNVIIITNGEPVISKKLFFPASIILVVDSDLEDVEECNKNNCNDLNFHKHKKIIDEFSYYTVVRTTEPSIQGYTLEEDAQMTVAQILDIIPLSSQSDGKKISIPFELHQKNIRKNILLKHINDKKGLTPTTLIKAINESDAQKLRQEIKPAAKIKAIGRHTLDMDNAIDWDKDPTIYQATTLSHGHLLQYKQEWVNDGYSMGDLLYSLPLAPGQKKQIVVLDWERRETASREESQEYNEQLNNFLGKDRDVSEVVFGILNENTAGGSSARTSSASGGLGLGFAGEKFSGVLGVSGGASKASSHAWQDSSRSLSLNDLQQIRDKTIQSANATRGQRSTVVQSAGQAERFAVETEVVANHNHCHSLTIQYFEVLRHLNVNQRLSSVQECLFIPLIMSSFDNPKILRWRESLYNHIYPSYLRRGFSAIDRIEHDYEGSDLPEGSFADADLISLEGHLYIKFEIPSPIDLATHQTQADLLAAYENLGFFGDIIVRNLIRIFEAEAEKKIEIFNKYIAPEIAAAIVEYLDFHAITKDGTSIHLPIDTSLISKFQNNKNLYLTLHQDEEISGLSRNNIKAITIDKIASITLGNGKTLGEALPDNTKVIISSGTLSYSSEYNSGNIFKKSRINDDLIGYSGIGDDNEKVRISTPLSRQERHNPRKKDLELANSLHDHLNDNIEYYHKVIWTKMSAERRFMLLDGIQVTDYSEQKNYPGGVIRSVSSVVENRIIGIVGNSLVMPVSPGMRLDPNTRGNEVDLISLYKPLTPGEPIHVSLPTKGVFAEAVLGTCNSCEHKEDDRFWRWSEDPIPDSPTAINAVDTGSRRTDPLDTTPSVMATPVVNIQNSPTIPDPSGMAAMNSLLGKSSFTDITGLDQNQKNALAALTASYDATKFMAGKAADMSSLNNQLESIKKAKSNNLISDEKAKNLTESAINKSILGTKDEKSAKQMDTTDVGNLAQSANANGVDLLVKRPSGETIEVKKPSSQTVEDSLAMVTINPLSGDTRSFKPSKNDKTGVINLEATKSPTVKATTWYVASGIGNFTAKNKLKTAFQCLTPGLHKLSIFAGQYHHTIPISIPQFVEVKEDAALFKTALQTLGVFTLKKEILAQAKTTCDHILKTTNVRTVWTISGEKLPTHLSSQYVTIVTFKDTGAKGAFGKAPVFPNYFSSKVYNEKIEIYPGGYVQTVPTTSSVTQEIRALVSYIKNLTTVTQAFDDFTAHFFGRLIGETMAHEIIHTLLGHDVHSSTHNTPAIANDIMNTGAQRNLPSRTGYQIDIISLPLNATEQDYFNKFIDKGLSKVNHLTKKNQDKMDKIFPIL
ncbi:MAG: hypothetical protein GY710_10380 [Desulfobacteraceae bacterium]|nr:hypothetical protein [Desulfobacteraceae bacterium]